MTILRDITNDKHREVEQTPLIQYMFNEKISEEFYKMYLSELFHIYNQLERCANRFNLFDGLEGLRRSRLILEDICDLSGKGVLYDPTDATKEYLEYLKELDSTQIMAHIYVRHMGDLYGGKMLSRIVPGSGRCYQFDNRKQLIYNFNERITLDLADEALKSFDIFIGIFNEMWERWNNMNEITYKIVRDRSAIELEDRAVLCKRGVNWSLTLKQLEQLEKILPEIIEELKTTNIAEQ